MNPAAPELDVQLIAGPNIFLHLAIHRLLPAGANVTHRESHVGIAHHALRPLQLRTCLMISRFIVSNSPYLNRPISELRPKPIGTFESKKESRLVKGVRGPAYKKVANGLHDSRKHQNGLHRSSMSRSWLARSLLRSHQEREIACRRLKEELL